jgi:hypothetical protein
MLFCTETKSRCESKQTENNTVALNRNTKHDTTLRFTWTNNCKTSMENTKHLTDDTWARMIRAEYYVMVCKWCTKHKNHASRVGGATCNEMKLRHYLTVWNTYKTILSGQFSWRSYFTTSLRNYLPLICLGSIEYVINFFTFHQLEVWKDIEAE